MLIDIILYPKKCKKNIQPMIVRLVTLTIAKPLGPMVIMYF